MINVIRWRNVAGRPGQLSHCPFGRIVARQAKGPSRDFLWASFVFVLSKVIAESRWLCAIAGAQRGPYRSMSKQRPGLMAFGALWNAARFYFPGSFWHRPVVLLPRAGQHGRYTVNKWTRRKLRRPCCNIWWRVIWMIFNQSPIFIWIARNHRDYGHYVDPYVVLASLGFGVFLFNLIYNLLNRSARSLDVSDMNTVTRNYLLSTCCI